MPYEQELAKKFMRKNWNNKGRIIFSAIFFVFSTMLLALCCILYPDSVNSGSYMNSAHGDSSYGVNRSATAVFGYAKGNCAHCHEQHAMIGGSEPDPAGGSPSKFCLLADNFSGKTTKPYSQSDNVCFYCHISTNTLQSPSFSNYSYSITFGGNPDTTPNNIFDAFNSLSYHNLNDTYRFITGLSGSHPNFTNFPSDSNPCSGCHNIHIAQKSCGKPSGSFDTTKSAISKPSDHGNLWGDSAGEKMSDYTGGYQAPYYNSAVTYEPDGSGSSDPSKLPNYVTFCTDCHNSTNSIYSTVIQILFSRNVYTINFANEMHGGFVATYCSKSGQSLLAVPYDGLTKCGQYVLSCTDCHEPHGSPNNFLVRKQVNNGTVTVTQYGDGLGPDGRDNKEWVYLCGRCHTNLNVGDLHTHPTGGGLGCMNCHAGGGTYRNCMDCHFHGNSSIDGTPYGKPLF
jgi:hypothetical protein